MVEEEKKGTNPTQTMISTSGGKKAAIVAPSKTFAEIVQTMEDCVHDAARSSIDFINYLTDEALNLDPDVLEAGVTPAIELFTSDDFIQIGNMINNWKMMHSVTGEKLIDAIFKYDSSVCEKIQLTFMLLWPYLHIVIENAKKMNQQQDTT